MIPNPLKRLLLLSCIICLFSCQKEPGEGGNSSITGKVVTKVFNLETFEFDYLPIADRRVYILYGLEENRGIDEDTNTSYDGSFQFDYLREGEYRIFTYSDCLLSNDCPLKSETILQDTTITKPNQDILLTDFIITDL